jgi:hypothetical protein
MALLVTLRPGGPDMTRFEIETAELARFDRRLLADVGLLGAEGPHTSQLRKLPAKPSFVAALLGDLATRLPVRGVIAPAAR